MRINKNRVIIILIALCLWWTISIFVVPYMIPSGSVKDLDGRANVIDFASLWNTLPVYPRAIYYIGDLNCHQISNRTIYLNDNEMPLCARDVSIFVFVNVGLICSILTVPSISVSEGILNLFPKTVRKFVLKYKYGPIIFAFTFFVLLLLPTALDGFRQLLTAYESTNTLRLLTGAPCGFAGGFYLGIMITSIGEIDSVKAKIKTSEDSDSEPENKKNDH